MSGTNYNAIQSSTVKISLTDENGLATTAECVGNPNAVAVEAEVYANSCLMTRKDIAAGNNIYQNIGTSTLPLWILTGGGGGGTIGGTITTNQVGYGSALDTLTGSNNFTFDGNTISAYTGGNGTLLVSPGNFALGYYTGGGSGTALVVNDNTNQIFGQIASSNHFIVGSSLGTCFLGDDGVFGNGNNITINDATSTITSATNHFNVQSTGGRGMLTLDNGNAIYRFGDLFGGNGTSVLLDDGGLVRSATIQADNRFLYATASGGNAFIDINVTAGTFQLGTLVGGLNPNITWNNLDRNIKFYGGVQYKTTQAGGNFGNAGTQYKNFDFDTGAFGGIIALPQITGSMDGIEMTISDYTGNAAVNNITINAFAGDTIRGGASYTINQNYGSVTLHAEHFNNSWVITSIT